MFIRNSPFDGYVRERITGSDLISGSSIHKCELSVYLIYLLYVCTISRPVPDGFRPKKYVKINNQEKLSIDMYPKAKFEQSACPNQVLTTCQTLRSYSNKVQNYAQERNQSGI